MQVGIVTIDKLFGKEVHYAVPLYQRPYVWNEHDQWRPLWDDLQPLAEMVADGKQSRAHFMGASVQEPIPVPAGATETRRVIDGQQRLTTLQMLLKAFRDVASARGHAPHAQAIDGLLRNSDPLITDAPKRLKLWPTRTDQQDYQHVMDVASPDELKQALGRPGASYPLKNHNIANAYLFFHKEIDAWFVADEADIASRVKGLYGAIRDQLRLVVIDLDDKDDAQAIFETLNARGAPLLSADLVKNSLLGQLPPNDAAEAYRKYWQSFDSDGAFWRELIGRGHAQRARIETFLQHALTLLMGKIVSAGHLYNAYLEYSETPAAGTALDMLKRFKRLGDIYRRLLEPQRDDRLERFFYRLHTLDVVTAWPFILALYDRHEERPDAVREVLIDLETYLVRRMVCRLSTRGYGTVFAALTNVVIAVQDDVVAAVRTALLKGEAEVDRMPSDVEFEHAWTAYQLYENLTRPRMRLLLEAMEEALRTEFAEETGAPRNLTIEHVMPQGWREHWPLSVDGSAEQRDRIVQTIGNLTLLTKKFNPYQSNRPWIDGQNPECGKRANLDAHTVLVMNRELCHCNEWMEADIKNRASRLFELAKAIWPQPNA
ncbi:hypothetical protein IP86_04985 [Rhodopseudomonas sp. AAP120]|uniref:DUF262 domain-containing protein n=1 Tax=Rhodopseudomonas sp. AAP120 TaxID=1523430 RepID=UPI0006B8D89D|nr:DUF262 domain-containing protein [Rhodopseudomonas sp. AAP120]KPG01222.1 hypothetical protein IP86_04985 [Rhodopseudomonas sp. AAP120]